MGFGLSLIRNLLPMASLLLCVLNGCGAPEEVIERVTVRGITQHAVSGAPLSDVEICLMGPKGPCTLSDESGGYQLELPGHANNLLRFQATGYINLLSPVQTGKDTQNLRPVALVSDALSALQTSILGIDSDPTMGTIVFSISNGVLGDGINVSGVSVGLEPTSGDGPFYTSASGLPENGRSETSTHGGGVWLGITPGDYTFSHENIPQDCITLFGWDTPEALRLKVLAEHVTVIRIECEN